LEPELRTSLHRLRLLSLALGAFSIATASLSLIGLLHGFNAFQLVFLGLLFLAFFLPALSHTEKDQCALWTPFVILILPVALIVGSPLFFVLDSSMSFFPKVEHKEISPDGRWRVIVTRRVIFPPNDGIDPSIHVVTRLEEVGSGRVADRHRWTLDEDSDFSRPSVRWLESDRVTLTDLDERNPGSVTLSARTD
jgi:hypothetical protein